MSSRRNSLRDSSNCHDCCAAAGAIAACSAGYYVLCLWGAARFLARAKSGGRGRPPHTVSLRQFRFSSRSRAPILRCTRAFAAIVCRTIPNTKSFSESAIPTTLRCELVERLKLEFPQLPIRWMVCTKNLGANTKVSNLAQMLPEAKYEHILVNDSDIRVQPDYLRRVTAPLADPKVGIGDVSLSRRARPHTGIASGIAGHQHGFFRWSAGRARARRRHSFWTGFHARFPPFDLESIGGFEALVDYLADDYEIGRRIAEQGMKVDLSDVVVETFLPPYTLRQFVDHQLRWGRTVRDSRRWGYLGLVFTFGIPWALLALVLSLFLNREVLGRVGPAGRSHRTAGCCGGARGMVRSA